MLELKAGIVKAPRYLMPSPVKICAPALNHTGSCKHSPFRSQNQTVLSLVVAITVHVHKLCHVMHGMRVCSVIVHVHVRACACYHSNCIRLSRWLTMADITSPTAAACMEVLTPNSIPAYFSRTSGNKIPRAPSMAHLAWITSTVLYLHWPQGRLSMCQEIACVGACSSYMRPTWQMSEGQQTNQRCPSRSLQEADPVSLVQILACTGHARAWDAYLQQILPAGSRG